MGLFSMKVRLLVTLAVLALLGGFALSASSHARAASACAGSVGASAMHGNIDGANYTIEVPANWNGTLVLYSHGYAFTNNPITLKPIPIANPPADVGDPATGAALLAQGYALAGSSYSQNGWALQQAFHDQIALLDFFNATCGQPTRTIAWGHSLGGIITAGLVQLNPGRFAGALPMCGVLSGGVGTWNQALDGAYAFNVLLGGGNQPILHFPSLQASQAALFQAEGTLQNAQNTPQGQARIALAASLGDVPGWVTPLSPEPASTDYATQEFNQFLWEANTDFFFAFEARYELEARAGGNPSWNTGVDYRAQLAKSATHQEVEALYKAAGLSLDADLNALNQAPRISADPAAVKYLSQYVTFNGDLNIPVLAMHTSGDGLVVPENERAYANVVSSQGQGNLLRQIYVHRAGHCAFTPAETLTAFQTLINRINNGEWGSTDSGLLNQQAAALGPNLNIFPDPKTNKPKFTPPAFFHFEVPPFLRPFDARNLGG
jgi:pimeloyl-ACP methyl ester carboxylesterase